MTTALNDNKKQQYLAYDVAMLEAAFADLLAAFPELAEDETLRADTIEGETDAHRVLGRIIAIERDANSMLAAITERARELSDRKGRFERRKEAMRAMALRLMKAGGLTKVPLAEATVSVSKGRDSVEIVDEAALPRSYVKVTTTPDKGLIREALVAGKAVKGAALMTGEDTLRVAA